MTELNIKGDYHTHTVYSHGKGTVRDNVVAAKERGLTSIAITDHGFRHMFVGVSKKGLGAQYAEIDALKNEFPDIEILKGIEANLIGMDGCTDFPVEFLKQADIFLVGYHISAPGKKTSDKLSLTANAALHFIKKPSKKRIEKNTEAYINLVKNNPVDIITHPGYLLALDYAALGRVCAEYGTFIELSSRHTDLSDEGIKAFLKTDCRFVISSDAHKTDEIAVWRHAVSAVKRLGIPHERIANADGRRPGFRLEKSKRG